MKPNRIPHWCILAVFLYTGCGSRPDVQGKPQQTPAAADLTPESQQRVKPEGFGRFRRARIPGNGKNDTHMRTIKELEAIGYLTATERTEGVSGVTMFDETRACPGANLFCSGHGPEAILMDMRGNVLHRWRRDYYEIWPESNVPARITGTQYWRYVHLFDNGDILVIFEGQGIARLDASSRIIWGLENQAHHWLDITADNDIAVLTRTAHVVPWLSPDNPVLEDFITILSPDGHEKQKISIPACFRNSAEYGSIIAKIDISDGDIFHTNSVQVLSDRIASGFEPFKSGRVLISILKLHAVAVLDLRKEKAVWLAEGDFRYQHDARILENGHLLLFDNRRSGGRSRVCEYDPATMRLLWEYGDDPAASFYSRTCGACRRLSNGNTLITESDNGRAFEVTPDKHIVWEYVNPCRTGENGEFVATLVDMSRIEWEQPPDWLNGGSLPEPGSLSIRPEVNQKQVDKEKSTQRRKNSRVMKPKKN